jgi:hypothetical protein
MIGSGGTNWAIVKAIDNKTRSIGDDENFIPPSLARSSLLGLYRAGMHITTRAAVIDACAA